MQNSAALQIQFSSSQKLRLPTAIFQSTDIEQVEKWRLPTAKLDEWQTPSDRLFHKLSATHLIYLSNIKEDLKRAFYEQEAIRGCWTVKELDRQFSSLYYERMGVSNLRPDSGAY